MTEADHAALTYARQIHADTPQHRDRPLSIACAIIEAKSPDQTERAEARDLRILIEGEAA